MESRPTRAGPSDPPEAEAPAETEDLGDTKPPEPPPLPGRPSVKPAELDTSKASEPTQPTEPSKPAEADTSSPVAEAQAAEASIAEISCQATTEGPAETEISAEPPADIQPAEAETSTQEETSAEAKPADAQAAASQPSRPTLAKPTKPLRPFFAAEKAEIFESPQRAWKKEINLPEPPEAPPEMEAPPEETPEELETRSPRFGLEEVKPLESLEAKEAVEAHSAQSEDSKEMKENYKPPRVQTATLEGPICVKERPAQPKGEDVPSNVSVPSAQPMPAVVDAITRGAPSPVKAKALRDTGTGAKAATVTFKDAPSPVDESKETKEEELPGPW